MSDFYDPDSYLNDDADESFPEFEEFFKRLREIADSLSDSQAIRQDLSDNYDIYCLVTASGSYYPTAGTMVSTIPGWVLFTDSYSARGDKVMVDLRNVQAIQYTPRVTPLATPLVFANAAA